MKYELLDQLVMASVVFSALCIIIAFLVFAFFDWLDSLSQNSGEENEEITIKEQTNMKNIFCKIIELEEHQVLVQKAFDKDGDGADYKVKVTMSFEGVGVSVNFGYIKEKDMDEAFDNFDVETAKKISTRIDKMVEDNFN